MDPENARRLATPIQFVPGVGPDRAELLRRLELNTLGDLLFFFPRDHEDPSDRRAIADLEEDLPQTVIGTVMEVDLRNTGAGRCILGILLRDEQGDYLRALFFNQPAMRERFPRGHRVAVSGKPKMHGLMWEMTHPKIMPMADNEQPAKSTLLPIYPLTEGLQQWRMRKILEPVVRQHAPMLDEVFPEPFLAEHNLLPICQALPELHFPTDPDHLARARHRFIYQELLVLQLALALKRQSQQTTGEAAPLICDARIDARIRRLFPFDLTEGQRQTIAEITADVARPTPMNRLLQGDVGSGKTVVAAYAMLLAVACGYQVALMAPTEVLARQHAGTFDRLLAQSQVRRAQLVGGMSTKQRTDVLERIARHDLDMVVGTHAIIQQDVSFAKLALVVIDEQHKFGVRQRAQLKQATLAPHYLVMTATPIPRTVTMTLFGDLDVSTLRDSPPGRQQVRTYLAEPENRPKWWKFLADKIREGRQAYVITPLVDRSDQIDAAAVKEHFEHLATGPLAEFRLGLIHGRMTADQKDAVMADFRSGEIQVLVATSVVEVGVDVPNATLMTIENGERFGLAQLHQLRGRISRGRFGGFCTVFAEPTTDESRDRLAAFINTNDGFRLAELDLELRGPGELFGTRQHGLPPLHIADLVRDAATVERARADAQTLVTTDPGLSLPTHALLRSMALRRYGKALELADVG